jgi:hypothetical protein
MPRKADEYRGLTPKGVWVYGSYLYHYSVSPINNQRSESHSICDSHGKMYEVRPETVGRNSGKCDKDQSPIFQGDVVLLTSCTRGFVILEKGSLYVQTSEARYHLDTLIDMLERVQGVYIKVTGTRKY